MSAKTAAVCISAPGRLGRSFRRLGLLVAGVGGAAAALHVAEGYGLTAKAGIAVAAFAASAAVAWTVSNTVRRIRLFPFGEAVRVKAYYAPRAGVLSAWSFVHAAAVARNCGPTIVALLDEKIVKAKQTIEPPRGVRVLTFALCSAVAAICLPFGIRALAGPVTIESLPSLVVGYFGALAVFTVTYDAMALWCRYTFGGMYARRIAQASEAPARKARGEALIAAMEMLNGRMADLDAHGASAVQKVLNDVWASSAPA
jgi:hypothetical protein